MTGATHMIVSAAISRLGLIHKSAVPAVAFGSHFLLDAFPHHGMSRPQNYTLSAVTGSYLCYTAWKEKDYFPLLAVFFGILPDIIDKLGISPAFSKIHDLFYSKKQTPDYFLLIELLVASFLLVYLTV